MNLTSRKRWNIPTRHAVIRLGIHFFSPKNLAWILLYSLYETMEKRVAVGWNASFVFLDVVAAARPAAAVAAAGRLGRVRVLLLPLILLE